MASPRLPSGDTLFLPPPSHPAAGACTTLCCACGVPMPPNAANTCARCLRARVDVTEGAPRHAAVVYCPSCSSYLEPPRRWTRAAPESPELMQLLLRRVQRPLPRLGLSLTAAEFVFTEPHSKRLKLRLRLRREVLRGVALEQDHAVEFAVHDRLCDACGRARADPDQWCAVVQLRQRASHRRTLLHLEQRLASLGAADSAIRVEPTAGGLDFFFASRSRAAGLVALITSLAPARTDTAKQLVSHDTKSNSYRYKHAFSVELCPVCRDDLVFLPRDASRSLGGLGPLVLCVKVTDTLALLDASTHRVVHLGMKEYDRHRFEPVLNSRQLVEYVVLDVDPSPAAGDATAAKFGYQTAYAQVARASELGRNDAIVTVRTHLGHLLGPGDRALGYDLRGANANGQDIENYGQSHCLPDAVLVKKIYEKGGGDKMHQAGSNPDDGVVDIDEIAMGIGGIDLDPADEVELDELLEDLRL
ncbi:60S ribosomal export protein NMD3-like [Lolium rigidum]|uniref:60S ribosomal export protein NMD3-like n=1 Tax=Lolium rigidum TaxID=89674 RepID=UPI001F5D5446|nr:60S ribosomal export protein NMD3-like [Lolium rigidum]